MLLIEPSDKLAMKVELREENKERAVQGNINTL
jgi:hypothetical protein